MRTQVKGAKRIVVKVGSSSLTTAVGGLETPRLFSWPTNWLTALFVGRVSGSSGRHRRRARTAWPAANDRATWPRSRLPPAWARDRSMHRLYRGVRPLRAPCRPGAADGRRRDQPLALPQRPRDVAQAARPRGRADGQRERHGGDPGDPLRRQRPAGRAGAAPGARRPAGPAVRRRRPLRRRPGRRPSLVRVVEVGGADLDGVHRRDRHRRGRHRRHGDQGRGGPDRHRRGHPGRRSPRPGRRRRAGWERVGTLSTPGSVGRPACCGWRTRPPPGAGACWTRARSAPSSSRRASLLPAGVTASTALHRGRSGRLLDAAGGRGRPRTVNYDALELPQLLGKSGHTEVIHRDDLVLL